MPVTCGRWSLLPSTSEVSPTLAVVPCQVVLIDTSQPLAGTGAVPSCLPPDSNASCPLFTSRLSPVSLPYSESGGLVDNTVAGPSARASRLRTDSHEASNLSHCGLYETSGAETFLLPCAVGHFSVVMSWFTGRNGTAS